MQRRCILLGGSLIAIWAASPARALFKAVEDEGAGTSERVRSLIARMTIEEKAGQLTLMTSAVGGPINPVNPDPANPQLNRQLEEVRRGSLGGLFNLGVVEVARVFQMAAVKETRLGIPLIFAADIIHGFQTIFPVPLAEASSFDPDLCERTARAAAVEAAAVGLDWTFAPMVDVARDARWGRSVEGAGEDVLLNRRIAAARVKGFQGRSLRDDDAVLACAKHFAAYGAAEGGLDYSTVDVSERTLREVYLPPFKSAFDAGALSTMAAFNEISGVPATANAWLMRDVLRREWGFGGLVVSDYTGDLELVEHGVARDERDAARIAIMAGVDMSMASGIYRKHLPDLVAKEEVPLARVDEAVGRVLAVKERLGLLDDPFRRIDAKRPGARIGQPRHVALAREAARRSIVMLKNEGGLLPLPTSGKRIALIGPFAEGQQNINGPWTLFAKRGQGVDIESGVRAALSDPSLLTVVKGVNATSPVPGGIEAATAAAKAADVVLMVIGETEMMSGEAQSRSEVVVPEAQLRLVEAVATTGKPIVVLLKTGRALALDGAVLDAKAILVTWFLGSEGSHALADVLFGKHGPSGRLPVSFPRRAGQVPYYYAHKSTGRPDLGNKLQAYRAHYSGVPNSALFPFGHGLTYGDIVYEDLRIAGQPLDRNGEIRVTATVTNRGARPATEVVQLYVRDVAATLTRPLRELKDYRLVELAAGKSVSVSFALRPEDLGYLGVDLKPRTDAGIFRVWISPSAEAEGVTDTFELRSD